MKIEFDAHRRLFEMMEWLLRLYHTSHDMKIIHEYNSSFSWLSDKIKSQVEKVFRT